MGRRVRRSGAITGRWRRNPHENVQVFRKNRVLKKIYQLRDV